MIRPNHFEQLREKSEPIVADATKQKLGICSICGKELGEIHSFGFVCPGCGLVSVSLPKGERKPGGRGRGTKWLERVMTALSNWEKRMLISSFKKGGRVLDIGCGSGDFLAALGSGWEKHGVEPHFPLSLQGKKSINCHIGEFDSCRFKSGFFDLVTLWHVLEHLPDSRKALKKIRKLSKKGGRLIISTPNTGGWGYRLTGRNWFHLDPFHHRFLFNEKNLKAVLAKSGWEIERVDFPFWEYPFSLFRSFMGRLGKRGLPKLIFAPFLLVFSLVLAPVSALLGRGETVRIVAKKK